MAGIILVVVLALGAAGAVKAVRAGITNKSRCAGEAIASLTSGPVRCAGEGSTQDPSIPAPQNLDRDGTPLAPERPPPESYKSMSEEEMQEAMTVLERASTDPYVFADYLRAHPDPRDQARIFDLAANFHMLGEVLDHTSRDRVSRQAVVEGLKNAFESGSLTKDELAHSILGSGRGARPGETHENLASIVAATGDPSIIEAYVEGEIRVLDLNSEDIIRLPSVAAALAGMTPSEREDFFDRRPDVETVMDIYQRHLELKAAGLPYVDTDLFSPVVAINAVSKPENRKVIDDLAARYGVDPALLEGVIAAEIDFDRDRKDVILDKLGRGTGIGIGQGWGVAAVHGDSLDKAIDYLKDNKLPGSQDAQNYDKDVENRASFEGSIEGAAIMLAWLADVKRKNGGSVDSAEDMAVIWGAYRAGVVGVSPGGGGFASPEDYANNKASGTDKYLPEFEVGGNAYQSTPFFEYFKSH